MEKFSKKIILGIFMFFIIITISSSVYAAGSFTINKSSANLTTGNTTTITVTANSCAGQFHITSSNTNVATVSVSSIWLDNSSETITINSKAEGTATISITAADVTDTELNDIKGTKTCQITVTAPEPEQPVDTGGTTNTNTNSSSNSNTNTTTPTKSSNSRLSSLQIAEGVISPEFDSSVREYTINVPNEITKLSIAAVADHSKATVRITGNEELQVGENTIEIIVTAENGSTTTYKILATRELPELNLEKLSIYYINEEGNKIELILDPQFVTNIYEYVVTEKLSNKVEKLEIETTANRENAKIEIVGNNELKAGKNEITIKVTLEDEAGLEEQKTYKITVEREEKPVVATLTTWEKIENWFTGVGSTIGKWVSTNIEKIITGMLIVATATFVGLTIYFAYDYKNYKSLLSKLAELNKTNLMERANIALDPENVEKNINEENIEEVKSGTDKVQEIQQEEKKEVKSGKGKRFK